MYLPCLAYFLALDRTKRVRRHRFRPTHTASSAVARPFRLHNRQRVLCSRARNPCSQPSAPQNDERKHCKSRNARRCNERDPARGATARSSCSARNRETCRLADACTRSRRQRGRRGRAYRGASRARPRWCNGDADKALARRRQRHDFPRRGTGVVERDRELIQSRTGEHSQPVHGAFLVRELREDDKRTHLLRRDARGRHDGA